MTNKEYKSKQTMLNVYLILGIFVSIFIMAFGISGLVLGFTLLVVTISMTVSYRFKYAHQFKQAFVEESFAKYDFHFHFSIRGNVNYSVINNRASMS